MLSVLMMAGTLLACGKKEEPTEPETFVFDAYVFQVNNSSVLVGPVSGEKEIAAAADKGLLLNRETLSGESLDYLEPGMLIRVTYNGVITYSLPAQIPAVLRVEILES